MLLMWVGATFWYATLGFKAVSVAFGIHIFSWIIQFVGHGVFEGRKPALLDSLFQSIVLAPLFVWFHVLFFVGYRRKLQHDVEVRVQKNIAEAKAKSQ